MTQTSYVDFPFRVLQRDRQRVLLGHLDGDGYLYLEGRPDSEPVGT